MSQVFFAYSSNYQTLRISGINYPTGTYKGTFDASIDPTQGGTIDWKGYFNPHASQIRQVIIEDVVFIDYANNLFDGLINCTSIQGIENIHGNLLNTTRMFANTPKLTNPITLNNLISINCLDATEMFAGAGAREIILDNINMKNCTSTKGMFKNAKAEVIEMTSINTNSVRYSDEMFQGCTNLKNIYGTGGYFDFSAAITSTNMFDGASLLTNYPNRGLDKFGAISIEDGGYINMAPYTVEFVDVRIREKYDTKANWLLYDPVLFEGELAIESDTNRFKVGDGAHTYSELPYMYGFKVDNRTIIEDSETTELKVPIDEDTIIVEDGKLKSVEKLHADQTTIMQDSEGKLFLDLDDRTIKVNDTGELEAVVEIDNSTIKEGTNGLYVPIDNDTVFVDTDGRIKSKGDLTPGVGLEWDSPTSRVLNVKLGKTIDEDTTGINVNYDGRTIYWDDTAGHNGALRGKDVRSADGSVKVTEAGLEAWDLSLPLDNDTIVLDGGVIKATTQVPEVDNVTIKLVDDKLSVPIDNDTIFVEGGKLKAQTMPEVDNETIIINSEGKLEAVNQMPAIDEKTLVIKDDKLQVAIDNDTIVYDSENEWIEVPNRVLQTENGIYARVDSEETLYIGTYTDDKTLGINNDGELGVKIDDETIVYDKDNDWIEVNYQTVEFDDGLIAEVDSETTHVKANVDNKTIFINSEGQLEGAPNVLVDGTTIIQNSEDVISVNIDNETIIYNAEDDRLEVPNKILQTENGIYARETSEIVYIGVLNDETLKADSEGLGVKIDHETIVYDKDNDWIEVNYQFLEGENGIYLRNDSETTFIGVDVDGTTILINSEGKLTGAPNVECDERTIVHNSEGKIEVAYDHDTIVFDEENKWLEVDGIEITPIAPVYIKDDTSESGNYFLGCGYDNVTITLNEKNELQTAVGGGWRCDPEEKIIATGTNVPKHRHHMLPDDDADYFLETVWFPNPLQEKPVITATVTHDASFMDDTVELTYIKDWDIWYYDGRYWESEGIAPEHPLNPHGYSIYVQRNKTVVQLHEDFEIDPDTLTCTISYGGKNCTKEYIDNQFVKVDNETVYVNNEGELAARLQLQAGKWIQISEGTINMGNLCQGLAYNEESDCIYVKDATDSEVGGVKIDNETLKVNENGQLAFDLDGMLDRGLDASTGKIGHTNEFVGDLRQAGDPTSTVGLRWDDQGHLTEVERYDIPTYLGATAYTDGVRGFVPAASSANRKSFLRGDGSWASLLDANLFSVISTEGSWWVGTDRRTRVFSAEPTSNQIVIAPLGFTVDRDTEAIDTIYMVEMNLGHITITARSNTQAETLVKCKAYWLVMNL